MQHYKLALIGFGGVNRALAGIIQEKNESLCKNLGFSLSIVAITDLSLGTLISHGSIDPADALAVSKAGSFQDIRGGKREVDNHAAIETSGADIIVEATFTNPTDGEPATSHLRSALKAGKHAITTNKGPVALHALELKQLAEENGLEFEYEGSVMSGTPVIRFARHLLAGNEIRGFEGVLNGTSNYVLERMSHGLLLEEAVKEAQELGYAEADPRADIGGSDVSLKVKILAQQILAADTELIDITTEGIEKVTLEDIEAAKAKGKTLKLIGKAQKHQNGRVVASVGPVALDANHPLTGISGAVNAVTFKTDLLGSVTVSGPGAGTVETAYALLSDIIAIHHSQQQNGANQ